MSQNNWDEIWNKAKEVGKAVGDVAGEVVDVSRQKIDELKKRRELKDCYLELGHLYNNLLQDGKEDAEKAQEISERIASLKVVLETARKACRSKDQEIHMVACPHCNRLVPSTAAFCSYCGKAIYPADENK